MKTYLSSYWNKSCIFTAVLFFVCMIATLIMIGLPEEGIAMSDHLIFLALLICVYILIPGYLMWLPVFNIKLVRYTVKSGQQITMYSVKAKELAALNLKTDVYYEVLPLIEGMYSTKKFIILSNKPFAAYKSRKLKNCYGEIKGLGAVCKEINKDKTQIIMPYMEQDVSGEFDVSLWHIID